MIAGFVIRDYAKHVYIRCLGPSLSIFGVSGALADPTIQLFSGQTVIAQNDDWGAAPNIAEINATGTPPFHPRDSAIMTYLEPGNYTVVVRGVGNATGVALIEVNEVR